MALDGRCMTSSIRLPLLAARARSFPCSDQEGPVSGDRPLGRGSGPTDMPVATTPVDDSRAQRTLEHAGLGDCPRSSPGHLAGREVSFPIPGASSGHAGSRSVAILLDVLGRPWIGATCGSFAEPWSVSGTGIRGRTVRVGCPRVFGPSCNPGPTPGDRVCRPEGDAAAGRLR